MFRLYFIFIISILLIISTHTINGFFLEDLTNITSTRNITCRLNDTETIINDFQYCSIRIYNGSIDGRPVSYPVYDGLRYFNTFNRFIAKNCGGFVRTLNDGMDTGTGSGSCIIPRSFETFAELQLCICATDNCNQDWESCVNSSQNNINITTLPDFIPALLSKVPCNDTLISTSLCEEHPFINVDSCLNYTRMNSVLCAITIIGDEITQTSLVLENYEAFLTKKIYEAKTIPPSDVIPSYNETNSTVYFKYFDTKLGNVKECVCISYSQCNENINTCVSQTVIQIEETTYVPLSTQIFEQTTFGSDDASASTSTATDTSTSVAAAVVSNTSPDTSTAAASSTSLDTSIAASSDTSSGPSTIIDTSTVINTFISSTVTTTSANSNVITTPAYSTVAITSVDIATSIMSTDSTTIVTSTDLITTVSSTLSTTTTPIPGTYLPGETGLGRAATAGIACGIIFSIVVFAGEIAFFKFVYPKYFGSGAERSFAYQA